MVPPAAADYPRTFNEFIQRFSTEEACLRYLEEVRWRDGFWCPKCGEIGSYWRMGDGLRRCVGCRARTSVTAGTVFDKTRYPLQTWFHVMWHVVGQKNGVSALGLQRELGLGSYQTAWAWLHKLRRAMVRPGRDMIGGHATSSPRRSTATAPTRTATSRCGSSTSWLRARRRATA